ncbi:heavy-metal-associated domain-containing protein [Teichococcus oryzae]|nr:cation transporter [Pseudoroseomonas oryzae]
MSESESMLLKVEGMDCAHCVRAVTEAIKAEDPQAEVVVDLNAGTVSATTILPRPRVATLVEEEGYTVAQG